MNQTETAAAARTMPRAELIAMVGSLIAVNALAIDIMLPAMQQIGEDLGVANPNERQLVITAYFLGLGLFQLVFGPLSDRFGRKRPLFFGLAVYVTAALCAVLVTNFYALLALRFLQGAGAAGSVVIAIAMVRDRFKGPDMAQIMSFAMMVLLIVPVVAPSIGQVIMLLGNWHLLFLFMAVLGTALAIWSGIRLPETLTEENRRPFTPKAIIEGFGYVFGNRASICYILATALIIGCLFGFLNSSQQIYVGIYQLGVYFPLAFAAGALVMALGSFANATFVQRLGQRRMAHGALLLFLSLSFILALMAFSFAVPLPLFIVMVALIFFAFSAIGPNFGSLALEPLGHVAGTAASTQGAIQIVFGSLAGGLIGQAFDGSIRPMALCFVGLSLAALVMVLIAEKGKLTFGPGEAGSRIKSTV
jgi:MFS transporter, DHA1 family, multidrug resistance protein